MLKIALASGSAAQTVETVVVSNFAQSSIVNSLMRWNVPSGGNLRTVKIRAATTQAWGGVTVDLHDGAGQVLLFSPVMQNYVLHVTAGAGWSGLDLYGNAYLNPSGVVVPITIESITIQDGHLDVEKRVAGEFAPVLSAGAVGPNSIEVFSSPAASIRREGGETVTVGPGGHVFTGLQSGTEYQFRVYPPYSPLQFTSSLGVYTYSPQSAPAINVVNVTSNSVSVVWSGGQLLELSLSGGGWTEAVASGYGFGSLIPDSSYTVRARLSANDLVAQKQFFTLAAATDPGGGDPGGDPGGTDPGGGGTDPGGGTGPVGVKPIITTEIQSAGLADGRTIVITQFGNLDPVTMFFGNTGHAARQRSIYYDVGDERPLQVATIVETANGVPGTGSLSWINPLNKTAVLYGWAIGQPGKAFLVNTADFEALIGNNRAARTEATQGISGATGYDILAFDNEWEEGHINSGITNQEGLQVFAGGFSAVALDGMPTNVPIRPIPATLENALSQGLPIEVAHGMGKINADGSKWDPYPGVVSGFDTEDAGVVGSVAAFEIRPYPEHRYEISHLWKGADYQADATELADSIREKIPLSSLEISAQDIVAPDGANTGSGGGGNWFMSYDLQIGNQVQTFGFPEPTRQGVASLLPSLAQTETLDNARSAMRACMNVIIGCIVLASCFRTLRQW